MSDRAREKDQIRLPDWRQQVEAMEQSGGDLEQVSCQHSSTVVSISIFQVCSIYRRTAQDVVEGEEAPARIDWAIWEEKKGNLSGAMEALAMTQILSGNVISKSTL